MNAINGRECRFATAIRLAQSARIEISGISGEVKAVLLSLVSVASAIAQPGQQAVAGVIHGTVVGSDGTPAAGIGLNASPDRPLGGRIPFTRTDQSGNYRFERLDLGATYTVYADDEDAGYSVFTTGVGQSNPPKVTLSPDHPEATVDLRLPPKAGFVRIHLTNKRTGTVISGLGVTLTSSQTPPQFMFSGSSSSDRVVLIPPDRDLLLHVTSWGFHEWDESAGRGKPIRVPSGNRLELYVQLEPE